MVSLPQWFGSALAVMVIGWLCCGIGGVCQAEIHGSLSPELQEIVKLSQAQVGDDTIIAHIKNSGMVYHMSADDIIFLKGEGVSPAVINALVLAEAPAAAPVPVAAPTPMPAPAPTPMPTTPVVVPQPVVEVAVQPPVVAVAVEPAPEINFDYFHRELSPWGTWIQVGDAMYWRPDQAIAANPDWRPYYDNGQWTQTDNGLFWQSDYSWGDIPFHYGRWVHDPMQGWLWAPDYTWGPSWVFWRHGEADAAIGWAPLPPGADFVEGGLMFHGAAVAIDFDFGMGDDCFTFIGYDHFHERFFRLGHREYAFHIDHDRRREFFHRSVIRNEFRRDEHGRFVNEGIGHERVAKLTKVEQVKMEERSPVGDRDKLQKQREEVAAKQRPEVSAANKATGNAEPMARPAPKPAPVSKAYIPPVAPKAPAPTPAPAPKPAAPAPSAPAKSSGSSGSSGKK